MIISDKQSLKNQDLVLKVSPNVDPARFHTGRCQSSFEEAQATKWR